MNKHIFFFFTILYFLYSFLSSYIFLAPSLLLLVVVLKW